MKYLSLLAKQLFIVRNTEDRRKRHQYIFSKIDNTVPNPLNGDDINNHIAYLHKLHTEQIIHEKELEENPNMCSYMFRKISSCMKF